MKTGVFCLVAVLAAVFSGCRTAPDIGWEGRKVAFLGDSITDPRQKHAIYWQYLADWLDWDVRS